jgi:hypothetical protein
MPHFSADFRFALFHFPTLAFIRIIAAAAAAGSGARCRYASPSFRYAA